MSVRTWTPPHYYEMLVTDNAVCQVWVRMYKYIHVMNTIGLKASLLRTLAGQASFLSWVAAQELFQSIHFLCDIFRWGPALLRST